MPNHASVLVPAGPVVLEADLELPESPPTAVVLFAHGSGSSRFSPRNRYVASMLREGGWSTLLIDLLTREEERVDLLTAELRFDIGLLAGRLTAAIDWLAAQPATRDLPIGCFGASTGAAAALSAAAERPAAVRAVVSRGGRPDLTPAAALRRVQAPALFIVGGNDVPVIAMNKQAMRSLRAPCQLEIVPGASHLFEEPGALERVAELASEWFARYLPNEHYRERAS